MRILVFVGALLCLSLPPTWAGEGSLVPDEASIPGAPTETRLVTAAPGRTVSVSLDSNPSTGYRWRLAGPLNESIVKLAGSHYKPPVRQIPGAGGTETWRFNAVGRGKTSIVLEYVRPWEKKEAPARKTVVKVIVK
jgi:predicted secreted protein